MTNVIHLSKGDVMNIKRKLLALSLIGLFIFTGFVPQWTVAASLNVSVSVPSSAEAGRTFAITISIFSGTCQFIGSGTLERSTNGYSWVSIGSYNWEEGANFVTRSESSPGTYFYRARVSCVYPSGTTTSNTDSINIYPSRVFSFEGYSWTKQIRGRGSASTQDYYSTEYNKPIWTVGSSIKVVEGSATFNRYVGVSTQVSTGFSGALRIQADVRTNALYSGQRALYVGIFDTNWNLLVQSLLTTSSVFESKEIGFVGLAQYTTYNVFFYYSDGWSSDYNAEIEIKNVAILQWTRHLVFVHGFMGSPSIWSQVASTIASQAYYANYYTPDLYGSTPCDSLRWDGCETSIGPDDYEGVTVNDDNLARRLKIYINTNVAFASGLNTIDFVAHSMGGLVVRALLDYYAGSDRRTISGAGGTAYVETVVTIASPHQGIDLHDSSHIVGLQVVQMDNTISGRPQWISQMLNPSPPTTVDFHAIESNNPDYAIVNLIHNHGNEVRDGLVPTNSMWMPGMASESGAYEMHTSIVNNAMTTNQIVRLLRKEIYSAAKVTVSVSTIHIQKSENVVYRIFFDRFFTSEVIQLGQSFTYNNQGTQFNILRYSGNQINPHGIAVYWLFIDSDCFPGTEPTDYIEAGGVTFDSIDFGIGQRTFTIPLSSNALCDPFSSGDYITIVVNTV